MIKITITDSAKKQLFDALQKAAARSVRIIRGEFG